MSLDLITRTLLIGGALMNISALAYLLGIAYVLPLAYGQARGDELSMLFFATLITASTVFSWFCFRADRPLLALICMYAWWVVGAWFITALIKSGFSS